MDRFLAVLGLVLATLLTLPMRAAAQLRGQTDHVLAPGASMAAPDDADAVDVNPAALGFLDGVSLTYVHAEAPDTAPLREGGDAVRLAVPLLFGVTVGASAQSIRPTGALPELERGMGNVALAWAPSSSFGVGASVRWFGSQDPRIAGTTGVDLGISYRPAPLLAISLLGRDLNAPLGLGANGLPASFALAVGVRPTGTRELLFDVAGIVDTDGRVALRGLVGAEVPYVGRLFASAELDRLADDDRQLTVLAGARLDWDVLGAGGGAFGGEGYGDGPGWFVSARIEGFGRRGIPTGSYVADVEVSGLGARGIVTLVRTLDLALHDDAVAGVLLRFRDSGIGSAYAQEIRLMVSALETAGKRVVCHFEAASGAELYACGGASRRLVDPAGGVWLVGPSSTTILVGDLARTLGIRVDSVRIGDYKSAVEVFENRSSSAPARLERDAIYDDVYARLVADLSRDLDQPPERVRALIDEGPYVAPELVERGLVADRVDAHDLGEAVDDALGGSHALRESALPLAARRWSSGPRIGVVVIDGDIVAGDNVDIPILGIRMSGADTVVQAIDALAGDPRTRAIILRIDSPGGSVIAADQIWRAVMRARRSKPVIASMGAIATSAAYEIASAADEIWADPGTLTGSIGVFFVKVDFAPLAELIGVGLESFGRGRHAGLDSLFRPFTPEERAIAADKVRIWYRMFLERVAEGRGMEIEAIDAVGRGRVWTGDRAVSNGLVDRLGGFGSALARVREISELPSDASIVVVPERPVTLLDYVLGTGFSRGSGADASGDSGAREGAGGTPLPVLVSPELRELAAIAAVVARSDEGMPLARIDRLVAVP
jgi:protease-4